MYIGYIYAIANGSARPHNEAMCNLFRALVIGLFAALSITLTSCRQTAEGTSDDKSDTKSVNGYLNDDEIRNLITNNLLMTDEELPYGYGYLFYPNNRGMKLSEWSSNIAYLIRDGCLCIIPQRGGSSCYRFMKIDTSIYRIHFQERKTVREKVTIKPFIRKSL